jgi:uncharacterized protein YsxB (DUF464 family)
MDYQNETTSSTTFTPSPPPDLTPDLYPAEEGIKKADKLLKQAVGLTLFIAFVNILLGTFLSLSPSAASGITALNGLNGLSMIVFGVLYMGMALGIHKRSRTCTIIAFAVFVIDAVLTVVSNITSGSSAGIAGYGMKVVIIIGLVEGLRGCFQYHSLRKKYSSDSAYSELFSQKKKAKPVILILCTVVACAGLGAGIFGAVNTFASSNDIEKWNDYTSKDGVVTMKVPSSVSENQSTQQGMTYWYAESNSLNYSVILTCYKNVFLQRKTTDASVLEKNLIDTFLKQDGAELIASSEGTIGTHSCTDASFTLDGKPGRLRAFSVGSNLYLAAIGNNRSNEADSQLMDDFLNSMEIK